MAEPEQVAEALRAIDALRRAEVSGAAERVIIPPGRQSQPIA